MDWLLGPALNSFENHLLCRASVTSTMQLATANSTKHSRKTSHLVLEGPLLKAGCAAIGPGDVLIGNKLSDMLPLSSREERVLLAGEPCRAELIPTLGLEELSIIALSTRTA